MKKLILTSTLLILVAFKMTMPSNPASRAIASQEANKECRDQEVLASLRKESAELQQQLNHINQLLTTTQKPQAPIQYGILRESFYSKWARENQGFSPEFIARYHQQVMEQRESFHRRLQNSWTPQFASNGNLLNPIYGHGPGTFETISTMYRFPTLSMPLPQSSAYLSPISEQITQN